MNSQGPSRIFRTTLKDILKKPYDLVVGCDQFGRFSRTDPTRFPRTFLGGAVSIIFFSLAIATIVMSIVLYHSSESIACPTNEYPSWNSVAFDSLTGARVTLDPSTIIPSLKLDLLVRILEFGSDGFVNLRPIAVLDQTQKFPDLILAADLNAVDDAATTRFTSGTLLSDRVRIGTADLSTRLIPATSAPPPYVRDLHSSMILSQTHLGESSYVSNITRTPFFPHVATVVVALPRYQLEHISPCQLQLTLVNNGQFMYMNHSESRPSLAPAPELLSMKTLDISPHVSRHFPDRSHTELFSAQIELSGELLQAFAASEGLPASQTTSPEFNNYRFSVNYLPRTNFSVQNYSCPAEPQFSVHYAQVLSIIEPTSDRVHVSIRNVYPSPPFQMVLSSPSFQIVVQVIAVRSSSLYTDALELVFHAVIGPIVIGFPALLGRASWSCDLSLYNDSNVCDCGCSSHDPDCDDVANPVHGCADGLVCAQDGKCITQDADSVYVSSACQNIITPGTFFTSGRAYTSAIEASTSCPVCPNDIIFNQNAQWNHETRSFECGSSVWATIPSFQNMNALTSLQSNISDSTTTASFSVILADHRSPFPEGFYNPPLILNGMLSGSVHSILKVHSVARAGALDPVPDSSSALRYKVQDFASPGAWFPVTADHKVKIVIVEGLGCYEAWANSTVYMEQGNYDARGQYLPGCPNCASNSDMFKGKCLASGELSCRAPSQGGGFNYRCVAQRKDSTNSVLYGDSIKDFFGVWQGYCDQMVGYSSDLNQAECSSNPCKQDFMINYNGTHVNYFSGAFTSGSTCTDIQKIRQRVQISGVLPATAALVLTAASYNSDFITLFAANSSSLFPVFGLKEVNGSAVLRIGHFNVEVRSATSAILSANQSSGSAFQSSMPGYFQVLRLKRKLSPAIMVPEPGSYSSISSQALVISASASGELIIQGVNGIWDLFDRQQSRNRCASAASNATKVMLKSSANALASVFTDNGAIVRRLVEVEPSKIILDFPLPSFVSLPALIHVTLEYSALSQCSSALGTHSFDIMLPPQQTSHESDQTPEFIDVRAMLLVQALSDVQATAAAHAGDLTWFCPNTTRPKRAIDGRVIPPLDVIINRSLTMTDCSRLQLGSNQCLLARHRNNSQLQCESALESPETELYIGATVGINNNAVVNSSNAEFLTKVATLQKPNDVDILFKFRMPAFPSSINFDQATNSIPFQADDSNFFFFHAASAVRGGVISDLHSVPLNLSRLPVHDPLIFPRMTLALADYAQDDILASLTSNSLWPRTREETTRLLSRFPSQIVDFSSALEELASNTTTGLRIQAGTCLKLSVFVSVVARFDVNSIGIQTLIGWDTSVIKTTASVHQIPDNRSEDFYVQFNLRIQSLAPSIQKKPEVSLRQIAIAVGGASFGYILLGLLLLRILQQILYSVTKYMETSNDAQKIHQLYLTGRGGNLVEFKGVRGMAAQSQPNALAT